MASVKANLLLQRYPLSSSHCAGKNKNEVCQLCGNGAETIISWSHSVSDEKSKSYLINIYHLLFESGLEFPSNEDDVARLLLSPSTAVPENDIHLFEKLSRRMIFKLHNERTVLLGGQNVYTRWLRYCDD